MTKATKDFPWSRSRAAFALFFFLSLLFALAILRLALLLRFGLHEPLSAGTVARIFLTGLHQDTVVAVGTTLPLLFWMWIIGEMGFGKRLHRILFIGGFFVFWTAQVFLFFVEYYFFDEFKSRFNTVAVDYLHDRTEVFGNIWASYPVVLIVGICAALALVWVMLAFWRFRRMWDMPAPARGRFGFLAIATVLWLGLWFSLNPQPAFLGHLVHRDWEQIGNWIEASVRGANVSDDRTLNEIASDGSIAFVNAALTRNLDYSAYYQTMDSAEAYQRVRKLLEEPGVEFTNETNSILRHVAGDASKPKLNVVILLEESLGSEFWGCLGRTNTLTPQMDKLATEEGMLFTNLYASGNRTVRGFEGVFSSFPPLPGDSVVKRDKSDNIETIARILKRDGYNTIFFYGGRGMFDSMRSYALNNGWDRFLEHNPPFNDDFPHPNFATVWGVSDEEVYGRAIKEFRALNETGKPFLGAIMSTSNHKPYTYPRGRILDDPEKPKPTRSKAVKYADWCLGDFFRRAKEEKFWSNTVFVVVADHGARVYGSQSIPIHSYEIPLVILGPAVVKSPSRVGQLGCSLDVAPTVLGLIGRPYDTMFFGRDLLKEKPNEGRVFINHNRDIGIMERDRMAVFGLQKTLEFYAGNPKVVNMERLENPTDDDREIEKDGIAVYQVADDLYMHERYRIDQTSTNAPKAVK